MFIEKILIKTKRKLSNIFNIFNKKVKQLSDRAQNLTSITVIEKNGINFYEAQYV